MLRTIILVGIGGAFGSILRYLIGVLASRFFPMEFPLGTFVVNTLGCLLIGIFIGIIDRQHVINQDFKLLLVTGFCGGFTTFSAFASENVNLLQQGHLLSAFTYIAASIILGLFSVWFGLILVKFI